MANSDDLEMQQIDGGDPEYENPRVMALSPPVMNYTDRMRRQLDSEDPNIEALIERLRVVAMPHSMLRLMNWSREFVSARFWDMLSIPVILISCVAQAAYDPIEGDNAVLQVLGVCVFTYFLIEMLMKMCFLGLYGNEHSYLRSNRNKFEFLLICGETLDFILHAFGYHWGVCQALVPMRLFTRVKSMRDLASAIMDLFPVLTKVLVFYGFVIFTFSILGVQLWEGELHNRCFLGVNVSTLFNLSLEPYYPSAPGEVEPFICSTYGYGMRHCFDMPPLRVGGNVCSLIPPGFTGNWTVPKGVNLSKCINWNLLYNTCLPLGPNPNMGATNFDNIGYAWLTVFQVMTLEGWTDIMYYLIDASSYWSFLYFLLVVVIGSFIIMNTCALVIATRLSGCLPNQDEVPNPVIVILKNLFLDLVDYLCDSNSSDQDVPPENIPRNERIFWMCYSYRQKLVAFVDGSFFSYVISAAVFLSVFLIAMEHHNQSEMFTRVLFICNAIFTIVFTIEMILKVLAKRWMYFTSRANLFDFIVTLFSLSELILGTRGKLTFMRTFRILRFMKVLTVMPHLNRQLFVLKRSMVKSVGLFKMLFTLVFIFSILGMRLFGGKYMFNSTNTNFLNDRTNFDSLLWSMVTVFQVLTQDDWNYVMYNTMYFTTPWAALYIIILMVIGKYVLLNVLVGIVVDSFRAQPLLEQMQMDDDLNLLPIPESNSENPGLSDVGQQTDPSPDRRHLGWISDVQLWLEEHTSWSLYLFSPQNPFRKTCQGIVSSSSFQMFIMIYILLSCLASTVERPDITPQERWYLDLVSTVSTVIFMVEMVLKITSDGLVLGKESYCRTLWNWLDIVTVLSCLLEMISTFSPLSGVKSPRFLKVLRLLQLLRPLRLIKGAPQLRVAVETLITSIGPMFNMLLICFIFIFLYGIFGVQLFKGTFYYCLGQNVTNITNRTDCLGAGYQWALKEYNFDNLFEAMLTLFIMFSNDGWATIMYDGLDTVGVDQQPVRNSNRWVLIYFISFIGLSFFLFDMFIGVMIETFQEVSVQQREVDQLEQLTQEQDHDESEVLDSSEEMFYERYPPFRRWLYDICSNSCLNVGTTIIVLINVLLMSFEHSEQTELVTRVMLCFFYIFTIILIIEVLLKFFIYGFRQYFREGWNVMDIAILLTSIVSIVLTETYMADTITFNPGVLRMCRILRLVQVLKAGTIRTLLKTIVKSLSQVGNITILFVFIFHIYATIGVELFGKLGCTVDYPCQGLHRYSDFRNFGLALLTLFKICTGDNWTGILKDAIRQCRPDDTHCTVHYQWLAPTYFLSFVLLVQFVLLNLVVAVVMNALAKSSNNQYEPGPSDQEIDDLHHQGNHELQYESQSSSDTESPVASIDANDIEVPA